jgi:siroheme synthase (precorrin-2 oxidase/ferrochelatase)
MDKKKIAIIGAGNTGLTKAIKLATEANNICVLHSVIKQAQEQSPRSKAQYQDYVTAFLISRIAALEIALEERK